MPLKNQKNKSPITQAEIEIIKRSMADDGFGVNYFLGYFFNNFQFRPWQYHFHHAHQKEVTVMAGVGSGKTTCVALSAFAYACTYPSFKFMNLAPTSWQSNLMFEKILAEADRKPANKMIISIQRRPYPSITVGNPLIGTSELLFRSAHDDAYSIQSWEGDWVNIDEAGQIQVGDNLMAMVGTRMRGAVGGRPRLKRVTCISTSYLESPEWLWKRMDMGIFNPDKYLSINTTSAENLSAEDIELYKMRIPEEQWGALLDGQRPDGEGSHFSPLSLARCEDSEMNRFMQYHAFEQDPPTPGWEYREVAGAGCVLFEMDAERNRTYLLVGDPGQGNPPRRNAGVVMVFDITDFPNSPATLRYFNWVYGNGKYDNFIIAYKHAYIKYRPQVTIIDSTSTQKLWPEQVLVREGVDAEGMNFSGDKTGMMVSAQNLVQRGLFKWPYIQGIKGQLVSYKIEEDKKLAQDIVMCILMVAYRLREYVWTDYQEKTTVDHEPVYYTVNRNYIMASRDNLGTKSPKTATILTMRP